MLSEYAIAFKGEVHLMSKNLLQFIDNSLVSRIAYDKLEKERPAALKKANDLLKFLNDFSPKGLHKKKERDFPFVECSTLADDIKYRGGSWQSDWHFIDKPWFDQGGKPEDFPDYKINERNLTLVIPEIIKWLRKDEGYE